MKTFLVLLAIGILSNGYSQTKEDWARTVNWDGISIWSKYMMTQPAFMGPNALPVPTLGNGSIDSNSYITSTAQFHFRKGDNTQNLSLYGNYCLVKDVISFDIAYVPVEFFQVSDEVKKERHVYYTHYYDKTASGDLIMNTNIRLLKKWERSIQLALRFGYRFASSRDLKSARYTDGTGYWFDFTFGKSLSTSLKWTGMAGFYCWQLTDERYRQNDAFLFGTGLEWNKNGWKLQGYAAGYFGYIRLSGDKPVVLRANAEKRFSKNSLVLRFQQGLHDFKYSSVEMGMKFFFRSKPLVVVK